MADLIDRFSTINDMLSVSIVTDDLFGLGFQAGIDAGVRTIANRPAVDAVPVVRCKDCKYYQYGKIFTDIKFCCRMKHGGELARYNWPDDGFCSYGERREENAAERHR